MYPSSTLRVPSCESFLFLLFVTKSEGCSTKANRTSHHLAEVPYADSYGLGGLAAAHNLVQQTRGRIKFFGARDRLFRTLHRLRLDTVLDLFEDEASALSSFH